MKRIFLPLALLLAVLMCRTAFAAKARYLAYDGDTGFHSRHLAMHTGEETCRACANYLKVRSRASGSASVSGHVEQADLLQLLDMSGNWARVRVLYSADTSPDSWPGLTGWVDASYLECGCSEWTYYNGRTDPIEGGEILTGGVNLRELPSMSSRSLGKCTRGERVRVLGRYDSYGYTFYRVTRRSGQNGFVRSDYLSIGGSVPSMHYDSGSYTPPDSGRDYDDRGYDGGVRATTYQLRVRATPNGEIIGHISQLDYLELLERSGNWARIRVTAARSGYDDCYTGLMGWVSTGYLNIGGDSGRGGGSAPASTLLGSYYGDEGAGTDRYSTLQIQQSGSGVLCRLSIYRLTAIDAYGSDRGGWLDVAGTDASGGTIRLSVTRLGARGVMVTVTNSTWDYLTNGETFCFLPN
ncbi:MAG: SH3 domain-containing protein [Clostridia bacterium]|nr:SH3 domain-containing protein [Clostridia bacterium]